MVNTDWIHRPDGELMEACYDTLLVDLKDRIATVRMNRDETRNALEYQLRVDMADCFKSFSEQDEIRVVILTGSKNAFNAGGDLKELRRGLSVDGARKYLLHASRIILAIRNLEKPVIAAVNGPAMGAGFSIAMACDIVIASSEAEFSMSFVERAAIPDLGATYFAPRLMGLQKAKELAFTGRRPSAHELAELGVINHVTPPGDLEKKALDLARQIAEGPPLTLGLAKKLLNICWNLSLEDALEMEAQTQAACFQSEDHIEGVKAFLEKRMPQFKGK